VEILIRRLSDIQFGVAFLNVWLMLFLHPASGTSAEPVSPVTSLQTMLVANAMIMVAGGAIDRFIQYHLGRSLFDPEIRRLAGQAKRFPVRSSYRFPVALPPVQLAIALYLSASLSLGWIIAGSAAWLWRVPVGLAISEAIYLAWAFEGLLMKVELEAIARRWTHVLASRARARAQSSGAESTETTVRPANEQPVETSPASSEQEADEGWFLRARYLLTELRYRGFQTATPVQSS
jgi:hypothetical protein